MSSVHDGDVGTDVIVLGGGPSGTAAGLTLLKREGVSVTIVESGGYDTQRIGESLTPGVRPLLEYLQVWDRFAREQDLRSFGSEAAWGSPDLGSLDYLFTLHGAGWLLDRTRFDRMLADEFRRRGGRLLTSTRFLDAQRTTADTWIVRVREPSGTVRRLRARYLIDATGRRALLAARLGSARIVHDRLVGVARVGTLNANANMPAVLQVEACEYGWWYTCPLPDRRLSAVLMTDPDLVRSLGVQRAGQWTERAEAQCSTGTRLADVQHWERPRVHSAASSRLTRVGGEGWVAVGDAAASHDPLSSSGIPHALGSGTQGALVAADALFAGGSALSAYEEAIAGDFREYRRTQWRYYRREERWPDAPFWRRRRTQVELDPHAVIARVDPGDSNARVPASHVTARHRAELLRRCELGRRVHEVVRGQVEAHPTLADENVILALQELVEAGRVEVSTARQPSASASATVLAARRATTVPNRVARRRQ